MFLGCSQLFISLGLHKALFGILFLIIEVLAGALSVFLAFALYPVLLLLQMVVYGIEHSDVNRFRITAKGGVLSGRAFYLSDLHPVLRFGWLDGNDVLFPQGVPGVSREHCRLEYKEGNLLLYDMNSTYGTFLLHPERKLRPKTMVPLSGNETFYLGQRSNCFEVEDLRTISKASSQPSELKDYQTT